MQQLSVGNVVSISVHLYRTHLKLYLRLSLIAYLWLLVPLYGWAKFFTISGLISRLAFRELMGNPESVKAANDSIKRRLWSFLLKEVLLFLVLVTSLFISLIFTSILWVGILNLNFSILYLQTDPFFRRNPWIGLLVMLVILIALLGCIFFPTLWLYSQFFVSDLPLAIENKINGFNTFFRSWNLTLKYNFSIQLNLLITFLVMLPVQIIIYLAIALSGIIVSQVSSLLVSNYNSSYTSSLIDLLTLGIIVLNGIIIMPLWQALKAVAYYNLRFRREGLDLQLSDRKA